MPGVIEDHSHIFREQGKVVFGNSVLSTKKTFGLNAKFLDTIGVIGRIPNFSKLKDVGIHDGLYPPITGAN